MGELTYDQARQRVLAQSAADDWRLLVELNAAGNLSPDALAGEVKEEALRALAAHFGAAIVPHRLSTPDELRAAFGGYYLEGIDDAD